MPFPIKTRASEYQQIFVLSIAIIILMHQQKFYLTVTEDKEHNRNSNTTNSTEDDAPLLQTLTLNSSSFNNCHVRLLLATNQQKVSKKFNKSAVAWIQMQCLIKGLSMEAGLLAVTLYYCFCRVRKIQKSELEPLLISCVTIASKLYNGPILSIKDGLALVNTAYPTGKIAKYEQELMQCVNFNLHLHTNFTNFQEEYGESDIYFPTCFLLELLLLKDISVLYEPRKFESLIVITRALLSSEFQLNKSETSGQIEVEFDQEIWANICEIMDKNSPEALIGKYRSSFDVDHFIQMIKSI